MRFELSDEQELVQESVRGFLEAECPVARLRAIYDADAPFDPALWKGMVELGLAGLHVGEEHGGAGLGALDLAVVAEVLGHGAAPGPFLGHALAARAIELAGSDAQRRAWLPRLASGDALGTVALAEPAGWQPEVWALAPSAALHGRKLHVPYAASADVVVVGTAGGGLALATPGGGLRATPEATVDRTRLVDALELDGAACEPLPGGAAAAPAVRDLGLVLLAADAFGGATRLVEASVAYAKTREQFGVPIGHFQAVKHQLADMALEVEPSRALYWYAAHALDRIPDQAPRAAALAKAHVTDRFQHVAREAVEVHGGYGFTWECEVQVWFKRAMFDRAFLGTPEVHRARAAALAGWSGEG